MRPPVHLGAAALDATSEGSTVLCEVAREGGLLSTWVVLTILAVSLGLVMSGLLFRRYYWRPKYAQWRRKFDPAYPSPHVVRREITQMLTAVWAATLCPAVALALIGTPWSQAYCGVGEHGYGYLLWTFVLVCVGSDFVEFFYHRLGHTTRRLWRHHKHHHAFPNPTPFAVIADGPIDQFARSTPMLLFPLIMPINMDLLFFTFSALFYGVGVYLHIGHGFGWPGAHNRWINSAYHHHVHHARSTLRRPLYTGFVLRLWDNLFASVERDPCGCADCLAERGERTEAAWEKVEKPDYSPLLRLGFWWRGRAGRIFGRRSA